MFSQHRASEIHNVEKKMEDLSKTIVSGNVRGIILLQFGPWLSWFMYTSVQK